MTKNECVANIIDQLRNGKNTIRDKDGFGSLYKNTIDELKIRGLINQFGTTYLRQLTKEGYEFAESGMTYEEWIKPKQILPHNITAENYFGGNIQESRLTIDSSRDKQNINNNTAQQKPAMSLFEWIVIIIGLMSSIITIYLFLK
ncbi:hypothetical protein [Mucilaginibacter sp.]|uniref:hypothetical protein n=1 Tax=Mucilaginibacter sp. TaxID=1882438 RepID=UPI003B003773